SGGGNLQRSALCLGGVVEVAELGHVHHIAKDSSAASLGVNVFVQFVRVRGGDDEKHAFEVGWVAGTRDPFDLARGRPGSYLCRGFGSDDTHSGGGGEEARDFSFGDSARANDEAALAPELEEHREEARGWSLFGDGLHHLILTENGKRKIEKGPKGDSFSPFPVFQERR